MTKLQEFVEKIKKEEYKNNIKQRLIDEKLIDKINAKIDDLDFVSFYIEDSNIYLLEFKNTIDESFGLFIIDRGKNIDLTLCIKETEEYDKMYDHHWCVRTYLKRLWKEFNTVEIKSADILSLNDLLIYIKSQSVQITESDVEQIIQLYTQSR